MNLVILANLLILAILVKPADSGESGFPGDSVEFGKPADSRESRSLGKSVNSGDFSKFDYICESTGSEIIW